MASVKVCHSDAKSLLLYCGCRCPSMAHAEPLSAALLFLM